MKEAGARVDGCPFDGRLPSHRYDQVFPGPVAAAVDAGVEIGVERRPPGVAAARRRKQAVAPTLSTQVRLLGPLVIERAGVAVALPPSRKARALFAYLLLSSRPVAREALADLLWPLPSDPRGELRGALSRVRQMLEAAGAGQVHADGDAVSIDLQGLDVDVLRVLAAARSGLDQLDAAALRTLDACFAGEFLQGLEIPRSAAWTTWLLGQRRHLRGVQAALLESLATAAPRGSDDAVDALTRWLHVAPFDRRAHERLLAALAARGQLREGDEHLAATVARFEAEGQDVASLVHAWRNARRDVSPVTGIDTSARGDSGLVLTPAAARRASIAVMPFADMTGGATTSPNLGVFLAHDVTTRLARLRSMFVIAPGSALALDARGLGAEEAARQLGVDYVASAALWPGPAHLRLIARLTETRTARIVWTDELAVPRDRTLGVLDDIVGPLVAAIAGQIELAERNRAVLKAPGQLDAWEALHRGLWHMYRFRREDNDLARGFFETAIRLDPTFSRPYAGLSFTHWQSAFQHWGDRAQERELAYRYASQAVLADDQDPAARWALGRAFWLYGRMNESLAELGECVELSPNFAMGHYALAFVHSQSGDAQAAIASSDHARALSPFDPLLFAMFGARAMSLMRLGRHDEAADWAMKALARPNAHVHIQGIAAHCLALAGRVEEARKVASAIHAVAPAYSVTDFLAAFHFDEAATSLVRRGAGVMGLK